MNTSPFSNRLSVISEAFTTTSSSGTKLLVPDKITSITGMMSRALVSEEIRSELTMLLFTIY